jgi:hypothetical protein
MLSGMNIAGDKERDALSPEIQVTRGQALGERD